MIIRSPCQASNESLHLSFCLTDMLNFGFQVVKKVPVLAGVCATDPFRKMDYFLKQVESTGFSGVQNFPTVGLFDGNFRQNLEETGMGYR